MAEMNDDELLRRAGVEVALLQQSSRTPREERMVAGFEDILRFHQTHGRAPTHGEDRDIFERLYAVRLISMRCREAKSCWLIWIAPACYPARQVLSMRANWTRMRCWRNLAWLSMAPAPADNSDITVLRHVRSSTEKRVAEEIASRNRLCRFRAFCTAV